MAKNRSGDAKTQYKFPAVPVQQGDHTFYLLAVNARLLDRLAKVSTRNPNKKRGYQRHFSNSRIASISRFVDSDHVMPTAVVVTFKSASFDSKSNTLSVRRARGSWIIDGQHRLLGAKDAKSEIELPVVAFIDLPLSAQIQQFVTINKEAKGVPSSLFWENCRTKSHQMTSRRKDVPTSFNC